MSLACYYAGITRVRSHITTVPFRSLPSLYHDGKHRINLDARKSPGWPHRHLPSLPSQTSEHFTSIPPLIILQKKMQQWFAEQKCCDMTIEIMLADDEVAAAADGGEVTKSNDLKVEIKAHSLLLGARSNHIE